MSQLFASGGQGIGASASASEQNGPLLEKGQNSSESSRGCWETVLWRSPAGNTSCHQDTGCCLFSFRGCVFSRQPGGQRCVSLQSKRQICLLSFNRIEFHEPRVFLLYDPTHCTSRCHLALLASLHGIGAKGTGTKMLTQAFSFAVRSNLFFVSNSRVL